MNEAQVSIDQGWRDKKGTHVLASGKPLRHVIYHSPTGLECGYSGSGRPLPPTIHDTIRAIFLDIY